MVAALMPTLISHEFQNWLKGSLAIFYAKDGLNDFVEHENTDFQRDLMQTVYTVNGIPPGTSCSSCTTANVLTCPTPGFCSKGKRCNFHDSKVPAKKPNQACPKGICIALRDAIRKSHRFSGPSWKNTDATRWCSDAFEVSKCFMPPDGYFNKTCLSETDFNGTVSVIINNKRFQMKMSFNLGLEPNSCTEARIIGREVRHSANHSLNDQDLVRYIDVLITLLSDPAYLAADANAKTSVEKLIQLKVNTITIYANDITKVLTDDIVATFNDQQKQLMDAIQAKETDAAELIHNRLNKALHEVKAHSSMSLLRRLFQRRYMKDLKCDLIRYYREHESTIPISPLVENHDVPLEDFYVQPPMLAFDKPHLFSQTFSAIKDSQQCQTSWSYTREGEVSSYREILFDTENIPYKHIYLSAQAGSGKTTISKHIAHMWCQAKSPIKLQNTENEDVRAMKAFSFVFLLHLREFQGTDIYNIDEMIWKMMDSKLPRSDRYSKSILQKILRKKRCLIVLDGLDEWAHPNRPCSRNKQVPHLKSYAACTTLITTRPWKLSTIGLTCNQIDRHVEITNLNLTIIYKLGDNALRILNKNTYNQLETQKLHDFLEKMYSSQSGEIITIPYVLLQFICLWHDGREIGRSKCEIYSNMINFTLERGLKRTDLPEMLNPELITYTVPKCMIFNDACKSNMYLLVKLGMLAFFSLVIENKESALLIDFDIVCKYLSRKELEFFLKIGLLSQSKDSKCVSKESFKVLFQHKSIQEFCAALYISSTWQNEATKEIVRKSYKSIRDILELSGVIIFVCGINCDACSRISLDIHNVVANDKITQDFRQLTDISGRDMLLSYQSMQVACFQENERNNNDNLAIPLQDIVVWNNQNDLQEMGKLAKCNENDITSIYLSSSWFKVPVTFRQTFKIVNGFRSLESLSWSSDYDDSITDILAKSACSLKYISIDQRFINSNIIDNITRLSTCNLHGKSLGCEAKLSHDDIKRLCLYLGNTKTLRKINLELLCIDHYVQCPDCSLDLSELSKLQIFQMLPIVDLIFINHPKELHLNTDSLEKCELSAIRFLANATSSFLTELQGAPVLSSLTLTCINYAPDILVSTIPTLLQLKSLSLECIDLGDNVLCIYPTMTRLENLKLEMITMKTAGWRELIDSVFNLAQNLTVKLKNCHGPSHEEWDDLFTHIKSLSARIIMCNERNRSIDFQTC